MEEKETPLLLEYIVMCGVKQDKLLNYILALDDNNLDEGLHKDSLQQNGFVPEILSVCPPISKPAFPLPDFFVDVFVADSCSSCASPSATS